VVLPDLRNALGFLQLFQRFTLAPRKRRAMLNSVLLISFGLLESFGVLFLESHPLYLLLEEAEGAATARAP